MVRPRDVDPEDRRVDDTLRFIRNATIIPPCVSQHPFGCGEEATDRIFRPFNARCAAEEMLWPSVNGGKPIYVPKGSS